MLVTTVRHEAFWPLSTRSEVQPHGGEDRFLHVADEYSPVWRGRVWPACSSLAGRWAVSALGWGSSSALSVCAQGLLQVRGFVPLGYMARAELLRHLSPPQGHLLLRWLGFFAMAAGTLAPGRTVERPAWGHVALAVQLEFCWTEAPFQAPRTAWSSPGRFIFCCLEGCISLEQNHRVRGKIKSPNEDYATSGLPFRKNILNDEIPHFQSPSLGLSPLPVQSGCAPAGRTTPPLCLQTGDPGTNPAPALAQRKNPTGLCPGLSARTGLAS